MRNITKLVSRAIAHIIIFPVLLWHWLWVPLLGRDRCLQGSSEWLSLLPGIFGQYLRNAFLSWTIQACHPTATISFGTVFSKTNARIDENVYVGPGCFLGLVHLQKDVLIGSGVHITSGAQTHGFSDVSKPIREQQGVLTLVTIGERSWIGSAAIVMADVGRNSVVGAGAVVTKAVPDNVISVGVPARVVQHRIQHRNSQ
ncbi:MAG: acyltransferase [Planctomycetia bacterium]|nr:acyltransferase [Planctomycetia bacterium]